MSDPASDFVSESAYEWLYAQTRQGVGAGQRGPASARALLDTLGAPDTQFETVRVVGTNGKGSTSAMLDAGLRACGLRVGKFTSPHLEAFEERIVIAGVPIAPAQVADFVGQMQRTDTRSAAFFDLTLALACLSFAAARVQWAVMEAGVGGVSDATQALSNVRAVALTNVALDHTAALGRDIASIARDKAGAALRGVPLLTTATGEALEVITQVAHERGAALHTPASHPELFRLPRPPALLGDYQRQNAALAAATLRVLGLDILGLGILGLSIDVEAGVEAALQATHPGRLEVLSVRERRVLLDGAHNPHAARALAGSLSRSRQQIDTLLFGSFERKDSAATLEPLLALASQVVFTVPGEQASDPHALARAYANSPIGPRRTWAEPSVPLAFEQALSLTPPGGTLLVAGSLYLVGEVRRNIRRQHQAQPVRATRTALTDVSSD